MTYLLAAILSLLIAAPAMAQEDGVFVDPESPAGKEYAIPLDEARRQATGATGAGGSGGGPDQPLFGEGIEPAGAGGGDSGSGSGGGDAGSDGGGDAGSGSRNSGGVAPEARSSAAIEAAATGGSETAITVGIAALVLLAGVLGGVALRRALRDA